MKNRICLADACGTGKIGLTHYPLLKYPSWLRIFTHAYLGLYHTKFDVALQALVGHGEDTDRTQGR